MPAKTAVPLRREETREGWRVAPLGLLPMAAGFTPRRGRGSLSPCSTTTATACNASRVSEQAAEPKLLPRYSRMSALTSANIRHPPHRPGAVIDDQQRAVVDHTEPNGPAPHLPVRRHKTGEEVPRKPNPRAGCVTASSLSASFGKRSNGTYKRRINAELLPLITGSEIRGAPRSIGCPVLRLRKKDLEGSLLLAVTPPN